MGAKKRQSRSIFIVISALISLAAALAIMQTFKAPQAPSRLSLAEVKHWDYQLQKINLDRFAGSAADLIVMDYARDGRHEGAFSRADIERVRTKPDGKRRIVVAYLSVGEAEEYRFYWQNAWKEAPPDWLFAENCRWPGNHLVRFWQRGWRDIVFQGEGSYLDRIIAAGFDGIYVDRIDAFWDLRKDYPDGRSEMLKFMNDLAAQARRRVPGFLIIAQNAEDLLSDEKYRASIDAIAKEDFLYGVGGTGVGNDEKLIAWSRGQLGLLIKQNKPVFIVEYLREGREIEASRRVFASQGLRPTFPTRALDGGDPLQPDPPSASGRHLQIGTPEFGATKCKGS